MGAGQPVELRGVSVMELRDGDISEETLSCDNLPLLTQIGAQAEATTAR